MGLNDLIHRVIRFVVIFSFSLAVFYAFQFWATNGIVQPPSDARFLTNFNNLDRTKIWMGFKDEHDRLDPTKKFQEPPMKDMLTIVPISRYEELIYPKKVVSFRLLISIRESQNRPAIIVKHPSFLVLVLDQSDRIRGKTYVRYATEDYFLKVGTVEYAFWFRVPDDMRGSKYSIIVEVFGASSEVYGQDTYQPEPQIREDWDATYGHIPWWDPQGVSAGPWFRLLAYSRADNLNAPPTSIINPWTVAFQASLLISGSITILITFWKKMKSYHESHPNLRMYESLLLFWVVSFLIFLFVVAIPH